MTQTQAIESPIPGYDLVWSDDFNGRAGKPDHRKWVPWALGPRRDAINTAEAARLDGKGHLAITTRRVERDGKTIYETGGVWTSGVFEPVFGYLEARIRFQASLGHWGAFWLNNNGMGKPVGDTAHGGVEMDIIEFHHKMKNAAGQYTAQQTLHWDGYGKDHKTKGYNAVLLYNPSDDFHTYGLLWTPDEYVFFIDGAETWRVPKSVVAPSQRPAHIILSLEVGEWAGKPIERDAAKLPDTMLVDWVKVWQKVP